MANKVTIPSVSSDFYVNLSELRRVLLGEVNALCGSFIWDTSKEGHEYWSDLAFRRRKLDAVAIAKIKAIIKLHSK